VDFDCNFLHSLFHNIVEGAGIRIFLYNLFGDNSPNKLYVGESICLFQNWAMKSIGISPTGECGIVMRFLSINSFLMERAHMPDHLLC